MTGNDTLALPFAMMHTQCLTCPLLRSASRSQQESQTISSVHPHPRINRILKNSPTTRSNQATNARNWLINNLLRPVTGRIYETVMPLGTNLLPTERTVCYRDDFQNALD